jgi:hypothetical protein
MLYVQEAWKFKKERDYKNAKRMNLATNEKDLAINIFKKAMLYDHIIRLVIKIRKDLLKETISILHKYSTLRVTLSKQSTTTSKAGLDKSQSTCTELTTCKKMPLGSPRPTATPKSLKRLPLRSLKTWTVRREPSS